MEMTDEPNKLQEAVKRLRKNAAIGKPTFPWVEVLYTNLDLVLNALTVDGRTASEWKESHDRLCNSLIVTERGEKLCSHDVMVSFTKLRDRAEFSEREVERLKGELAKAKAEALREAADGIDNKYVTITDDEAQDGIRWSRDLPHKIADELRRLAAEQEGK